MARLHPKPYPLPAVDYNKGYPEGYAECNSAFKELLQKSKEATGLEGSMIRFGVADGYAWYLVVSEKPLTLQHVPYSDAYAVHPAMIRGLVKKDIQKMVDWERAWDRMEKK